jgi:CHAD domain-containing protein
MESLGFILPGDYGLEQLVSDLSSDYELLDEAPVGSAFAVYDSFDWRLYQRGYALYRLDEQLRVRCLEEVDWLLTAEARHEPGFAWELPDGPIKEEVGPILGVRRLLKLVEGEAQAITLRVLNADEKTVARLVFEESCTRPEGEARDCWRVVWVQPVRGYPRYARELAEHFESQGFSSYGPLDAYRAALATASATPGDYSARLEAIQLSAEMRADEAVKVILRFTLEVIRRNEPGIQADLDSEFLHDYRVAVRRTRSALTQIRGVFPTQSVDHYKGEFAQLGQLTNPLRDLDVYLLKEANYREMLPDSLRAGIDPLFAYLREQRVSALEAVCQGLQEPRYQAFLAQWEAFLTSAPPETSDPSAPNASRPAIELARERIYKRYRRVIRDGEAILADESAADEALHMLRIDCKKLRYLLEFFASLFPPGEIEELVKQLKRLQDNLGDFNDLCVQSDYLLMVSQELPLESEQARESLAAIGCLVGLLEAEKVRVRGEFAETFRDFAAKGNRKRFRALFADGGAE